MSHYALGIPRPPKTLTELEQKSVLRASGEHVRGFRDHVIISCALGTGLREHELAALNIGDVYQDDEGNPRRHVPLRVFKRSAKKARVDQEVIVPDDLHHKLKKYWQWKVRRGEPLHADAPLFLSREGRRIATRTLRHVFKQWQLRAGFERTRNFHQLRHTACTNLYRRTKDPKLVQVFARHSNLAITSIYTHADDEERLRAFRQQPC